jgi:hypothetical protein
MKATDVNFELVSALRSQPAVSTRKLASWLPVGKFLSVLVTLSRTISNHPSQHHLAQRSHDEPSGQTCLAR